MKRLITICLAATMILAIGSVANAHWNPTMPYKMHYPQLPDPYGWDVALDTGVLLLDDWQCTKSIPVEDIHFWVSFKGYFEPPEDFVGPTFTVGIFSNIPANEEEGTPSQPDELLWQRTFTGEQYDGEYAGSGVQGWFNPVTQETIYPDHTNYYLVNIENIEPTEEEPLFLQKEGTIYWLGILAWQHSADYEIGWKTSGSPHFMDDALWLSMTGAGGGQLVYPPADPYGRGGQSIDLAFVITPEPATIALLGLGALSLIRRKRSA